MRRVFIVLFIVATTPCVAQKHDSLATTPKFAVKWSALNLASRFPAIQFGVEYRLNSLKPRWTMSHDVGIVVKTGNDTESYANKSGFKAMTELRYYILPFERVNFYASAELYFHRVKYDRTELIGYDCETGECNYYQFISWRRIYTMQRATPKMGIVIFLDPGKRLLLDISAGLGYRIRHSRDRNKPTLPGNSISFGTDSKWFESALIEDEETVAPAASFRVGFRFK